MNIFRCEDNYLIAGIVGGLTAVISILCVLLPTLLKGKSNNTIALIGVIGSLACSIVSTLFCYNIIVLVGYILSVIALGVTLTKLCGNSHLNTIYSLSPLHLFSKIIIPVSIFFEMFRPYFISCKEEGDLPFYSVLAGLGLNCYSAEQGKYATVITSEGMTVFSINWKDINFTIILMLLLFVLVIGMQALLVWRQFKDPDNARDWADFGIIITCIGAIFIYGMFTSNNFGIAVSQTKVEHISLAIPVVVILGVLNRVLYFEKVENFLDKMSNKIFKKA